MKNGVPIDGGGLLLPISIPIDGRTNGSKKRMNHRKVVLLTNLHRMPSFQHVAYRIRMNRGRRVDVLCEVVVIKYLGQGTCNRSTACSSTLTTAKDCNMSPRFFATSAFGWFVILMRRASGECIPPSAALDGPMTLRAKD